MCLLKSPQRLVYFTDKRLYTHQQLCKLYNYNTLILPYFNYCILVWGATISDSTLLQCLQKKVMGLITSSSYIAHTEPICKHLFLLKLTDMFPIGV